MEASHNDAQAVFASQECPQSEGTHRHARLVNGACASSWLRPHVRRCHRCNVRCHAEMHTIYDCFHHLAFPRSSLARHGHLRCRLLHANYWSFLGDMPSQCCMSSMTQRRRCGTTSRSTCVDRGFFVPRSTHVFLEASPHALRCVKQFMHHHDNTLVGRANSATRRRVKGGLQVKALR